MWNILFLCTEKSKYIDFYSFNVPDHMVSHIFVLYFILKCADPTRIILAPINADITVGENATMQCAASFDPALDLTFIWSFNGYVIDFNKENIHYQRNFMVRVLSFILLTSSVTPMCLHCNFCYYNHLHETKNHRGKKSFSWVSL